MCSVQENWFYFPELFETKNVKKWMPQENWEVLKVKNRAMQS